jgi:hypothetical protein
VSSGSGAALIFYKTGFFWFVHDEAFIMKGRLMAKARKVRGWRRAAVPWAALFGLVLPSSPRPAAFAPSCALRVLAFQAPKEDAGAASSPPHSDTRATLGPTRERFPALQHKRPWTAAARMLAMTAGGGGEGLSGGEGLDRESAVLPSPRKRSAGRAPLHESEEGLEPLSLPPALAQWIDRLPQDLLAVIERIECQEGGRAWLVGGCVRDCLSGLTPWEVDMASTLHPDKVLALFPRALDTGSERGTVYVRSGGVSCEVTTLRAVSEHFGAADKIAFGTSLRDDLNLRDLTMNALAVHVGRCQKRPRTEVKSPTTELKETYAHRHT